MMSLGFIPIDSRHEKPRMLGAGSGEPPEAGKVGHVLYTSSVLDLENRRWADLAIVVRRAQRGDREAFGDLVEQFQPTVYAIALRRLGNPSDALELTQEVFLHVLQRIGQLREPERFAGWLRQVAVRMAINRATRRVAPASVETGVLEGAYEARRRAARPVDQPRARRAAPGGARAAQVAGPRGPGCLLHPRPLADRDRRDARRPARNRQAPAAHGPEAAQARARSVGRRRPGMDRRPG